MKFGAAIDCMRNGDRVARAGWNGKGMWIAIQEPDPTSKMQQPYIYMSPVGGRLVPWLASQADMLADDWSVVTSEFERAASSEPTTDPVIGEVVGGIVRAGALTLCLDRTQKVAGGRSNLFVDWDGEKQDLSEEQARSFANVLRRWLDGGW